MNGIPTEAGDATGGTDAAPGDSLAPTILVIDNYDSFAYNLVQYVGEVVVRLGGDADQVIVRRNDAVDVDGIRGLDPDGIVVSPGPGTPEDAGVSMAVFEELAYPTLGVCLGHQALCAANGASVGHAEAVVHGKSSRITHDGEGVFEGLPDPVEVGRYHSLAVDRGGLPDPLVETARTVGGGEGSAAARDAGASESPDAADGEDAPADAVDESGVLMGVRHREKPHVGVQFHPESVLTDAGTDLVENFCLLCNTT